jgi:hypothetical protein
MRHDPGLEASPRCAIYWKWKGGGHQDRARRRQGGPLRARGGRPGGGAGQGARRREQFHHQRLRRPGARCQDPARALLPRRRRRRDRGAGAARTTARRRPTPTRRTRTPTGSGTPARRRWLAIPSSPTPRSPGRASRGPANRTGHGSFGPGLQHAQPFFLPLFTRVRGTGILRTSYPRTCIASVLC